MMPGFTAEACLYPSTGAYAARPYVAVAVARPGGAVVAPAFFRKAVFCGLAGAACLAAIADGLPGDEVPICLAWFAECAAAV
jgi:hypothetical protein